MKKIFTLCFTILSIPSFSTHIYSFDPSEGIKRALTQADTVNAIFLIPKQYSYYDMNNNLIFSIKAEYAGDFKNGVAKIKQNGKFGFVNKEGNFVIPPKYFTVGTPSEGIVLVGDSAGQFTKIINLKDSVIVYLGKKINVGSSFNGEGTEDGLVITTENIHNYSFSEGLINIENRFYNTSGNLVFTIPGTSGDCVDGMISFFVPHVGSSGKFGFVNKDGKMVIAPRFDYVSNFKSEKAIVGFLDKSWKYYEIDINGNLIRYIGHHIHRNHQP